MKAIRRKTEEIASGVHRLDFLGIVNAYLIVGDELTLVDAGLPEARITSPARWTNSASVSTA